MKNIRQLLILGVLLSLFSCQQIKKEEKSDITTSNNLNTNTVTEKRSATKEENKPGISSLDTFLINAISLAKDSTHKDKFSLEYVETMPDSSYQVTINIDSDFYFSRENPHVIIKRDTPGSLYIDVFSKTGTDISKVLSHEQWNMTYVKDTIRDVNGDGLKDFVVNWYGSSGCCLKGFSNVYLLRQDGNTFSEDLEFINPTFSPKERMVRGVCYGHPGETKMYKYKWKGEKVDTIEYVSYQKNTNGIKTGKVIISSKKTNKVLHSVPKEYTKIEGFDWFTGKGY